MAVAAKAHVGQFRKDGLTPYIVHPANVALAAARYGLPLEAQAAALLHDVLEDTYVLEEDLRKDFPDIVVDFVLWLSNASNREEHKGKPRAERKRIDCERLALAPPYAKMLKMLDRIDNLQTLRNDYSEKFCRLYLTESVELFKVLASAHPPIADELMAEIVKLEAELKA